MWSLKRSYQIDNAACRIYYRAFTNLFISISKESVYVCPRWTATTATMHRSSSRDSDSFFSLQDPGHNHLSLTPSAVDSELGQLAYSSLWATPFCRPPVQNSRLCLTILQSSTKASGNEITFSQRQGQELFKGCTES